MLTIRVLGELEVEHDGERLALPPSKKTRALLAYLAVTGRPHRRERLASFLWEIPDDPRGALRWSLSKLRGLVDEPATPRIVADREMVAFAGVDAWVDVVIVRRQAAAGLQSHSVAQLEELARTFRGEFLEGLHLSDLHDFQAWCVAEREEARLLHAGVLAVLIDRLSAQPEEALRYARTLMRIDSHSEDAHASVIGLLAQAGRRSEAMQQHQISLRFLEKAGIEQSGKLLGVWRTLKERQPAPAARPVAEVRAAAGEGVIIEQPEVVQLLARRPAGEPRLTPVEERGRPSADLAEAETERKVEQQIRFCTTSDLVRIAYATVGDGPPLVKTANWLTHLEYEWQSPVWRHWVTALAQDHTLIRYDERGNGLSDWDVEDMSFNTFVRDLETVVDSLGLDRFPLLGISQGCAVSIAYAVLHPERVTHLILYGGYAKGWALRASVAEVEQREALVTLIKQGWGQDNPAFRQVFTTLFVPDATLEQMRWFNELQRISTSPENAVRFQQTFSAIDVRPLLGQVSVPTLVLHARGDAAVPFSEGRELASSIPGATFVQLESRNHLLLEHEPTWSRFLAEMWSFISKAPR